MELTREKVTMDSDAPSATSRNDGGKNGQGSVRPVGTHELTAKGLAANSVSPLGTVTMGVGTGGPAYSIAASLGVMSLVVGVKAPAMFIVSFIPMLLVAWPFKREFFKRELEPWPGKGQAIPGGQAAQSPISR